MSSYVFPEDFIWGAATASFQIEGAGNVDGRKPSVWDTFSATPGRVINNDTGMVACDHYHRYKEDVALMKELGLKAYRFSVAWPRVLPDGTGTVNQRGLDFYNRLTDELIANGIEPHVTLFHWDSPQALEDKYGSWQSRQMAYDFADYCSVVVKELGDRVTNWMTINEVPCFTQLGYGLGKPGVHAPGTAVHTKKEINQTIHHAILAHGLATQAIRAATPQPCKVALVDNYNVKVPVAETPENIAATAEAFKRGNCGILMPVLTGEYYMPGCNEADMPDIEEGDMEIISQPLDALGLNVYSATYVRAADNEAGYEELALPKGYPTLNMPWLKVVPDTIYWGVRAVSEFVGKTELPMFISENGCACEDELVNGEVLDLDRLLYLRHHFRAAHRAIEEGYPLKGYFVWSFMDNFEWAWGYDRRFGITYVDYETQVRTPKQSFKWYQEVIKANRAV